MSERVLIIDDKEAVREVFRAHLAEAGFAVDVACSLPEAAMRLAATPYSAVISDVSLSEEEAGKEGLAIAAYIRALWDEVPVVILTGAPTSAAAAARLGVDAFLHKPVSLRWLGELIRERIAGRRGVPASATAS
jgi:two-component system, NtrC family, C4-dicarboxylate transport response regulator DctD